MNIAELNTEFRAGHLVKVQCFEQFGEWMLNCKTKDGDYIQVTRQRGGIAHYKTLEAAMNAAKRIGFEKVEVHLDVDE